MDTLQINQSSYFQDTSLLRVCDNLNIGIFGGSFNPPHQGHMYIAEQAIKYLHLNLLIWLVAPQNPLKKENQAFLPLKERLRLSKALTKYNFKIKVTAIEESFNSSYTYNTLAKIRSMISPNSNLIWIMGEDNLKQFHLFRQWQNIIKNYNLAVFARNGVSFSTLLKKSHIVYKSKQLNYFDKQLLNNKTTNLKFYLISKNGLSSTQIRENLKKPIITNI
ncbi:Nicotinate-nucleotide adenylyltransferase [Candidatus Hepatincolaceae symbiont of Richtersius coronifer]